MPLSIATKLGFHRFKECRISLVLADCSIKHPVGLVEDLPVVLGDFEIAMDFVVLEMDEEPSDLLIFRRPVLETARASIDVKEGKIKLQLRGETLKFDINKAMKKPTIKGKSFNMHKLDEFAEELLEEITTEDPLPKALSVKQSEFGLLDPMLDLDEVCEDKTMLVKLGEDAQVAETNEESKDIPDQDDDWNELRAPNIELKYLLQGLKYEFLGSNSTYPVIVSDSLSRTDIETLLAELRKYIRAIRYSLADIRGISPSLCTHSIHLEEESMISIEHQRRLNPNLREVVRVRSSSY